jgi:cob(I)alamin adenosyltransferase
MGHRLSKIYTRTGDDGSTGLGDGTRVAKDHARIEALGAVDEANSAVGVVLTHALPPAVREALLAVQHRLFDLGGELCIPQRRVITEAHVAQLERALDALNRDLPPLAEFVLPGGSAAAAACHLARTICRRAERRAIQLGHGATVNPESIKYLNRLSDLLFVMSRVLARRERGEVMWRHDRGIGQQAP